MFGPPSGQSQPASWRYVRVLLVWAVALAVLTVLDRQVTLGTQAMVIVLASAVSALWSSRLIALLAPALAVQLFTYAHVPPRQNLMVDLEEHGILIVTALGVSWVISLVMQRQRQLATNEHRLVLRSEQLRNLSDAVRELEEPAAQAGLLREALTRSINATAVTLLLDGPASDSMAPGTTGFSGPCIGDPPTPGQLDQLRAVMASGAAQRTGAHDRDWFLPMRGRSASYGAAMVRLPAAALDPQAMFHHAQALCDIMGVALERASAVRTAHAAREAAQIQMLRSTLLASISHDHRTPLATILGAASSLHDQADRLSASQRDGLVDTILAEATQLTRITDNTLQLARLDSPGLVLQLDWESIEEIVGAVVQRARSRVGGERLRVRVDPDLPLIPCDAILLSQLLDNLVDNALKYSGAGPVDIRAALQHGCVTLAVEDSGVGIPPDQHDMVFEVFRRGDPPPGAPGSAARVRRGSGVGLAVCRAIARVHNATLDLRNRPEGGARFILTFPPSVAAPARLPDTLPLPLT